MTKSSSIQLEQWTIRNFVQAIQTGQLSLPEFYRELCQTIREKDKDLLAFHFFDDAVIQKQVLRTTQNIEQGKTNGALLGVPIAVKDVFNTVEWGTEMGSPYWKGHVAGNNARVIDKIQWEDGIITGKTITAELAVHHPGPTKNPHNMDYSPGTSSMGSAVAVASGMSMVALGTQTGASITRPASYCGVFGFKPSYGLIPRTGVLKTTDTLDHIGYFANHMEDIILLLDVLRVRGTNYPLIELALHKNSQPNPIPRIGILRPKFLWKYYQPYVIEQFEQMVEKLKQDSEITIIEIGDVEYFRECHDIHATLYDKSLSYYFKEESSDKNVISSTLFQMVEHGRKISPREFHLALNRQAELQKKFNNSFSHYDLILTPSTANIAPKRNAYSEVDDTGLIWSLFGAPALNIPSFKGPDQMPFGLLAVTNRYGDYKLFNIVQKLIHQSSIQIYNHQYVDQLTNPIKGHP